MNKLQFYRVEAGLTQYELAEASLVPRWRIQQAESGILMPDFRQMELLANALGVPTEKIFGGRANSFIGQDDPV